LKNTFGIRGVIPAVKLASFNRKPYGYGHLKRMERERDADGLIEALSVPRVKKSAKLRFAVVTSLGRIGAFEATTVVSELLASDPAESVRCGAAKALGRFDNSAALPALRAALDDESEKVQMWAIRSLGQLRDRESIERLIGKLEDPDWGFRSYAASALGEIGDQRATEALIPRLEDSSSTVRMAASRALQNLGHPAR
jgi:HEAT repeat protein